MKDHERVETIGVLLKEETMQTVDHNIIQNTLVLENLEPFPGYLGENMPDESGPDSIFLVISKELSLENIFRISQHSCKYHNFNFDACGAQLFIYNNNYHSIRIKGLKNYANISDIQGCYIDHSVSFAKKRKINAPGLIKIEKIFQLEKIGDYVFKDLIDEMTFYIEIPAHLTWNMFRKITFNVKNNVDNSNFDAALGFLYLNEIFDFVRIYTHKPEVERLQIVRELYIEEIKKYEIQKLIV